MKKKNKNNPVQMEQIIPVCLHIVYNQLTLFSIVSIRRVTYNHGLISELFLVEIINSFKPFAIIGFGGYYLWTGGYNFIYLINLTILVCGAHNSCKPSMASGPIHP